MIQKLTYVILFRHFFRLHRRHEVNFSLLQPLDVTETSKWLFPCLSPSLPIYQSVFLYIPLFHAWVLLPSNIHNFHIQDNIVTFSYFKWVTYLVREYLSNVLKVYLSVGFYFLYYLSPLWQMTKPTWCFLTRLSKQQMFFEMLSFRLNISSSNFSFEAAFIRGLCSGQRL